MSLIANKKVGATSLKIGTPAPAKNYLPPTTTTNGVNTSRAKDAMSLIVDQIHLIHNRKVNLHYRAKIYCCLIYYYRRSSCIWK
jgi:hypothetical protein